MVVFLLVHVKIHKAREEVSIVSNEDVKWMRSRAHMLYMIEGRIVHRLLRT